MFTYELDPCKVLMGNHYFDPCKNKCFMKMRNKIDGGEGTEEVFPFSLHITI